jgi:RNA polymerase sigma-54 factor
MDESEGPKAKDYVTKKLRAARWIVQSIEQRRQTMIKVMEAIVKLQREFFEKGIGHLKPMTLQQVADEISMHESTVSRVTNKKYVQTPQGLFELKFFFSSGLRTLHGDDVSARSAKDVIVHLVEHEDKTNPMSDQAIADKLAERGIMISRRAVAKYREQLSILPARLRKKI